MVRHRNLLIGLALATLAGGASLAHSWATERTVADRTTLVGVVAVQEALPAGTRLESRMLTLRGVPRGDVLPGAYHTVAKATGRWTLVPLWPGDQVIAGRTTSDPRARGGSGLHPGERGVLVPVDPGIGRTVRPGDWVDVVAVAADDTHSSRLVPGVRVLRVEGGGAMGADHWVLLAVPPKQAQSLAEAGAAGTLRLLLRGGPEVRPPAPAARALRKPETPGPPGATKPTMTQESASTVEVIRGVDREPREVEGAPNSSS